MKKLKWILYVIAALFVLFLVTNPSLHDFEEFMPDKEEDENIIISRSRVSNYLVCSVYHYQVNKKYRNGNNQKSIRILAEGYYVAILKNFYKK